MRKLWIPFVVAFLLSGCSRQAEQTPREDIVRELMAHIDESARRLSYEDETEPAKWDEADQARYEEFTELMKDGQDPLVLGDVLRRCRERPWPFDPPRDPYWTAEIACLTCLGDRRDDAAARVLVELLCDEQLGWNGEAAVNIGHAITTCGEPCLPYLEVIPERHKEKAFSVELADYIRRGEIFMP